MKIKTFIKLGDICDISAGQGAPQGDSNYCDNGTPFVKAGNLIELLQGKNETDIQKVSEDVAKKHKLKKYTAGSILFAKSGMSCMKGYVYQLKNDSYVVSHLAIVKPIKDSSDYIEYCLRHIKPNSLVKDEAYPSISLQDISNLKIPLPSLEEQIKISKQLYICTQIINKHKKQLERYDTLIKSRFIEMFGTLNNNNYDIVKIGDVCSLIKDGTHQTPNYTDNIENGFKFLSSKDIMTKKIDWTNIKYIPGDLHEKLYSTIKPQRNDILMSKNGVNYGVAAVNDTDEIFDIYVSLALLRPTKLINPVFFRCVINSQETKIQFDRSIKGIGVPNLHLSEIKKTKIILPPLTLQNKFADFVQQIDKSKFEYTYTGVAA